MANNNIAPRMAFGTYDKIVIDGIGYEPVSSDQDSHILRNYATGELTSPFSHEELFVLRNAGRMQRVANGYYRALVASQRRKELNQVRISDLSKPQQAKLLWRKEYCDRFLRLEAARKASRSDESIQEAIKEIAPAVNGMEINAVAKSKRCGTEVTVRRPPSPTALRKWLRKYEAWGYDPIVLRDSYGLSGNRRARLSSEIYDLLKVVAERYADPRQPTKAWVYQELEIELQSLNQTRAAEGMPPLSMPSVRTLSREIFKLDDFRVMAAREGIEKAKKEFYIVNGGLGVTRPLERIEMDEWNVSLRTLLQDARIWRHLSKQERLKAEKTRLWVSAAIDCATRCIVGLYLLDGSPSSEAAVNTLRQVVTDKSDLAAAAGCQTSWDMGSRRIETICTDTGSAYVSHEFRAACAELQIEIMFPPAGMPQMRGRIERLFSTFHQQLVARFHGRTFENVVAKGDYDADEMANIDAEELYRMLVRYVVDVYHNTPHRGLGGETPRNAWIRLNRQFGTEDTLDEDIARSIFGTTIEASIQKDGVSLFGLTYQDSKLQQLRRQTRYKPVIVRVDQQDLGYVSVRTEKEWLTVPCKQPGMDGVGLREWVLSEGKIKREYADQAKASHDVRLKAIAEIRRFSDAATERAGIRSLTYSSYEVTKLSRWGEAATRSEAIEADDRDFLFTDGDVGNERPGVIVGNVEDARHGDADIVDAKTTADDLPPDTPDADIGDDDMFMEI